jgi:hypothetical protein
MPTYLIERGENTVYVSNVNVGRKQAKVDYRLNLDIMASFLLDSHPELLKTNQASAV